MHLALTVICDRQDNPNPEQQKYHSVRGGHILERECVPQSCLEERETTEQRDRNWCVHSIHLLVHARIHACLSGEEYLRLERTVSCTRERTWTHCTVRQIALYTRIRVRLRASLKRGCLDNNYARLLAKRYAPNRHTSATLLSTRT